MEYVTESYQLGHFHLPVRVGRYVLTGKIDNSVYRAVDSHSGHRLVCKVFDSTRYQEAMCAYSQLPVHPNINQVRDVVRGESRAFVFFPRSYGNLHALLRTRRRLREDTARTLFRQLVSSVAHCHDNGLVLRDLGLKKFVFMNRERTLLMLESVEDAVIIKGSVQGDHSLSPSPSPYTSPEMLLAIRGAAGRGSRDALGGTHTRASGDEDGDSGGVSGRVWSCAEAADVWALGVMLYVMLFGCYPGRAGLTRQGVVSPLARCLIRSALHSNPAFRLSASELLTHPWFCSQPCSPPHTQTPDQTVPI